MIELFTTRPETITPAPDQHVIPVLTEERHASLSAILLDPDYFQFILGQREMLDQLPLVKPSGLIPLKAKAWLDLAGRRRQDPTSVDKADVDKHRTDIFRLASILPAGLTADLPRPLADDLSAFLAAFPPDSPELGPIRQALRAAGISMPPDLLAGIIREHFHLAI
jgi:hypothetical protein